MSLLWRSGPAQHVEVDPVSLQIQPCLYIYTVCVVKGLKQEKDRNIKGESVKSLD
jgi:hypothetical protein